MKFKPELTLAQITYALSVAVLRRAEIMDKTSKEHEIVDSLVQVLMRALEQTKHK